MSLPDNSAYTQMGAPPPLPKRRSGSIDLVPGNAPGIEPYNTMPQPSAANNPPSIYAYENNISSNPPPPLPERQQQSALFTQPMRSTGVRDDQANTTTQPSKEEVAFQFDRHVQEIRRRRTVAKKAPPPDRGDFTRIEAESGKQILNVRPYLQAYFLYFVESLARDDKVMKMEPVQWSKMKTLLSRLYDVSNPVQSLGLYLERVMYWTRPFETSAWFTLYFTLWFYNVWLQAFISLFVIKILNNRFGFLGNFKEVLDVPAPLSQDLKEKEPIRKNEMHSQLRELIHSKDLTDWISQMKNVWGPYSQALLEENICYFERIKNLFRWGRPVHTWRVLVMLMLGIFAATFYQSMFVPAIGLFIGVEFFILLPMQKYYPRFSHVFSPVEWILWGVPTDAELAVIMLTRQDEKQHSFGDVGASVATGSVRHGEVGRDPVSSVAGLSPASKIKYEYQKRALGSSSSSSSVSSDTPPTDSSQEEPAEFHCMLRGKPGKLVITEEALQFRTAKILGKREVETEINWEDIDSIKKSKTMNLGFWSMPGITVTDINGQAIVFQSVARRDDAFRKLVVTSGKKWSNVA
ncbi:hypothetical protein BGZ50_009591 [Haplosporangium sp. Z 11]|nr:hypothetical protein BGZ50_009591 [Haplosporangium sp. Z 11]